MATLIFPEHPSPVADAEALRKACQGKSCLCYIRISIRNAFQDIHNNFGYSRKLITNRRKKQKNFLRIVCSFFLYLSLSKLLIVLFYAEKGTIHIHLLHVIVPNGPRIYFMYNWSTFQYKMVDFAMVFGFCNIFFSFFWLGLVQLLIIYLRKLFKLQHFFVCSCYKFQNFSVIFFILYANLMRYARCVKSHRMGN